MHNFFTKYNKSQNQIFVSPSDAHKYISYSDLRSQGKKTQYKGIPKYDFETINLFPFKAEVDFTINENFTEEEKLRLSIDKRFYGKNIVNLIGVYERIKTKNSSGYTSCCVGTALSAKKICKKQKGLRGSIGDFYYIVNNADVINFFESRGFTIVRNSHGQANRISFVKNPNSEEEANRLWEDVYEFDRKFNL